MGKLIPSQYNISPKSLENLKKAVKFKKGQRPWNAGKMAMVTFKCEMCGKEVTKQNKKDGRPNKFCSRDCSVKNLKNPIYIEKGIKARTGLRRTMEQRLNISGEKSKNWKGGRAWKYILGSREKEAGRKRPEFCELCGAFGKDTPKGICYDHNHNTGKFRGWICGRCNVTLGMVKDSTDLLQNMINYLNKNNG
jgi:endogenous inhibitor of DNA gyrase (YacG/DUF329 family)